MSASIISIADGRIPAAIVCETASPAASVEWNAASSVRTDSATRTIRTVTRTAIPSVPSEPTKTPSRSGPSSSRESVTSSPSGSTTSAATTWFTVKPYLRQCAPPEFSATLPPIVQTCWLDGSGA